MLFSSDSKSSADGGGNCSRVGSENEQSKLYHKNGHNISKNIYKLMTYFTQNGCYFTAKSVNTTSTFVPLSTAKVGTTSPTGGGRSVGIVRSRTKATEFSLVFITSVFSKYVSF